MSVNADRPASQDCLLEERKGPVARLTLNRPGQFNALSDTLLASLQEALERLALDPDLRCVVIAAAGRAFCAGHDLGEMHARDREEDFVDLFARCSRMMQAIRAVPVPVVAAVQGIATAAGCQLVAACDLAIAAASARFAVSGINVGLFCSTPAVALTRTIGPKAAFDMLVTGRFVAAEEAQRLGLVNAVVPDGDLDAAVEAYAATIASKSPAAIRYGKAMVHAQAAMPVEEAYRFAGGIMARNMMEPEARAGIDAFLAKRPLPTYS